MRKSAIIWLIALVTMVGVIAGCSRILQKRDALPADHTLLSGQLIIHSDFSLAKNHRLVQDLVAERGDLAEKLQLPPSDEPIYVFLFASDRRFQDFIREYYPRFPTRRAFFVESDTRLAVYAQWGDRVAEDLRHEVAHGYLHAVVMKLPLWLDEGLAEYFEVTRGQNGFNDTHVVELSARLADGSWDPSLERLEDITSASDMTQLDYAESWAWVHFLLETTPQCRSLLHNYLTTLRNDGTAIPLSLQIQDAVDLPNARLSEHVRRLAER